jgi:pimeloyl-ACP methyl ester carboxylesterase
MAGSVFILLAVMLGVGIALLAATLFMMAMTLLRPPRMTDGRAAAILRRISPGDVGLHYSELQFNPRDKLTGRILATPAWWIAHPNAGGRCVVLIHGYADGKIGAMAWAPLWHALGYNILAYDLRAHGYAGGRYSTAGFFERYDLDQILNELIASKPTDTRQIVLFGVSLGAAVALGTSELRGDIAGLVLECPYADYRNAIDAHAHEMQMPLPRLAPAAVRLAEWLSGADFAAVRPIEMLARAKIPVVLIDAASDPYVSRADAAQLAQVMQDRAAAGVPSVYWQVAGAAHVMGIVADVEEYHRRLSAFLESLRRPAVSPAAETARCQ